MIAVRPATVAMAASPLVPTVLSQSRPVAPGTTIASIVSPDQPGVMVKLDGAWLLRTHWHQPLASGQHLEVHLLPQDSDGLRLVLQLAVIFFTMNPTFGLGLTGWQAAATVLAGNVAINLLLPVKLPTPGADTTPRATYSTSLQGNRATVDAPIPVIYGRHRLFPPFAAEPYTEFDSANDQYYHALLCIGMGEYELEALQIDDTPIGHFSDVQYAVLPPGTAPTLVLPNVATAPEVSGQPLLAGRFVGGFAACAPRLTCASIGVDITFERGLGNASGASITDESVDIRIDTRVINDWGNPLGAWVTAATETITAATSSALRQSFTYAISPAARVEVRVVRITTVDDNPLVMDDATWAGLRGYLDQEATLAANATYLEVKIRASEQLNGVSQRRMAAIVRRKLRSWHPDTGWSSTTAYTRSIAWALADKWSNTEYGDGLADDRIDLQTLYDLHTTWAERQDRLDIVFDTATDSDQADQLMARAGRARAFWRNAVRTVSRDEERLLPVTAYTARDITPGSATLNYMVDASKVPDAIVVEYLDLRSWDWRTVTCNAPGVASPTRPEYLRLPGVTGAYQAEREGLYEAAARYYRRISASWQTELQGLLPAFGSAVVFAPALRGWGSAGDVVGWNEGTLTLTLSEPPTWVSAATHYISLVRDDGSLHDAIVATAGATDRQAVLATDPDFTPVTDDARRERTRYHFGQASEHRRTLLVLAIEPQDLREDGAMLVQVSGVLEDARVHSADEALLPGEGDEQDPTEAPADELPGSGDYIVSLSHRTVAMDTTVGDTLATITLQPDGSLVVDAPAGSTTVLNEWLIGGPYGTTPGTLFEVQVVVASGTDLQTGTSAATSTWLGLGTARTWEVGLTSVPSGEPWEISTTLIVYVRDVATSVIQASASVWFYGFSTGTGGE